MERKIVIYCSTRKFEGDDAVRTKLTLDYSLCTQEDINSLADDSAVIKWQNGQRRKKGGIIPSEATYVVPKPGTRAAVTMTPFEMLTQLFGKDKVIALVNAAGGDIDAVVNKFKGLLDE